MSLIATCNCGQSFKAAPHLAGKTVACPVCKQAMTIPLPERAQPLEPAPLHSGYGTPDPFSHLPPQPTANPYAAQSAAPPDMRIVIWAGAAAGGVMLLLMLAIIIRSVMDRPPSSRAAATAVAPAAVPVAPSAGVAPVSNSAPPIVPSAAPAAMAPSASAPAASAPAQATLPPAPSEILPASTAPDPSGWERTITGDGKFEFLTKQTPTLTQFKDLSARGFTYTHEISMADNQAAFTVFIAYMHEPAPAMREQYSNKGMQRMAARQAKGGNVDWGDVIVNGQKRFRVSNVSAERGTSEVSQVMFFENDTIFVLLKCYRRNASSAEEEEKFFTSFRKIK